MTEYYGLARSALSVLHANYSRMRKALGSSFLENEPGAAPVDPLTLSQIDPSLKGDKPTAGCGSVATNTGNTPGELSHGSGVSSAGSDVFSSSAATGRGDTPTTDTHRNGSTSTGGRDHSSTSPGHQPTDPSKLMPLPSGLVDPLPIPTQPQPSDPGTSDLGGTDSIFPTDFDWSSLPTMCPTGDLTYNILTGVSNKPAAVPFTNTKKPAEAVGMSLSEMDDANNAAARAAVRAAQATTAAEEGEDGSGVKDEGMSSIDDVLGAWQFEGDFSSYSVWGLLNQYTI